MMMQTALTVSKNIAAPAKNPPGASPVFAMNPETPAIPVLIFPQPCMSDDTDQRVCDLSPRRIGSGKLREKGVSALLRHSWSTSLGFCGSAEY
jgi:hypothetical protein